jgi:hypothetical protein
MAQYLKQAFVLRLEREYHMLGEITHSRMVELIEEEVIKNYINNQNNGKETNKGTEEGSSIN